MADNSFHSLQRSELSAFKKDVQDALLELSAEGWVGRRGKGSHLYLRSADRETSGVVSPGNKHNVNYLRQLRNRTAAPVIKEASMPTIGKTVTVPCPRPGCNRVYASLEQLNVHINVDHEHKVKCPDCDYYGDSQRLVNIHRSKQHGYESPGKAKRLAQEARRKVRQADIAAIEAIAARIEATPVDEELTQLLETPQEEQAVPAETPTLEDVPTTQSVQPVFTDERQSWAMDLHVMEGSTTLSQLHSILQAAGLHYEIRVWRPTA